MKVRELCLEDVEQISRLYVSVFSSEPWNESWSVEWAIDRLSTIVKSPNAFGIVLSEDKDVAVILGRSNTFLGELEFEIVEFFVDPEFQGKGIGSKLYEQLELDLKQKAYKKITLLTERGIKAEKFYLAKNFKNSQRMTFMSKSLA